MEHWFSTSFYTTTGMTVPAQVQSGKIYNERAHMSEELQIAAEEPRK
jgi:hypothetical protein